MKKTILGMVSLLAACGVGGGAALAEEGERILPSVGGSFIPVHLYDTDGRLGFLDVPFELRGATHTQIVARTGPMADEFYWGEFRLGGGTGYAEVGFHTSDFSEPFVSVWGGGAVASTAVPVSSIQLGMEQSNVDSGSNGWIDVQQGWIISSIDKPAPCFRPWGNSGPTCDGEYGYLLWEFLPGCRLFGSPPVYEFGSLGGCAIRFFSWGAADPWDRPVPVGPVRLTYITNAGLEDPCYVYDELYVDFSEDTAVTWPTGLLQGNPDCPALPREDPDPGLRPIQSQAVMVAALTGTYSNFTNLTPHMDRTADGAWDIADLVKWSGE